ncbi:MAG: hypothetical protein WB037_09545 [Pseudolabrys sp.]
MESDDGVTAVKNCYPNGIRAAFLQSAFPELYCYSPAQIPAVLALSEFRRYISPAFPDKACGNV